MSVQAILVFRLNLLVNRIPLLLQTAALAG
jgi:hypothetical protein